MEVRSATTDEMVLAFVRAEIDSPTERGKLFLDVLARICADRATLIDHADLRNPQQNYARRRILGEARGALSQSFPMDTTNRRLFTVAPTEVDGEQCIWRDRGETQRPPSTAYFTFSFRYSS